MFSFILLFYCFIGRSAVIQLLQGKVKPQKGFINFLDEKTVVTLNTTLPKNVLSLSVKDYLAKLSSSSDEVNKVLFTYSFIFIFFYLFFYYLLSMYLINVRL